MRLWKKQDEQALSLTLNDVNAHSINNSMNNISVEYRKANEDELAHQPKNEFNTIQVESENL